MSKNYDIIVIWWWPAGSSLIYNLSRKYKILLLEKSPFPRNKLCWWLLTKKSINLLTNKG